MKPRSWNAKNRKKKNSRHKWNQKKKLQQQRTFPQVGDSDDSSSQSECVRTPWKSSKFIEGNTNAPNFNDLQVSAAQQNCSVVQDLFDVESSFCGDADNKHVAVKYFVAEKTDTLIMLLEHPSSFDIQGSALLRVLFGSISILGFEINTSNRKFVPVYSSKRTLSLKLETVSSERSSFKLWEELKANLNEFATEKVCNTIIQACKHSPIIIAVKFNTLATSINFASSYIPAGLWFDSEQDRHQYGLTVSKVDDFTVNFIPEYDILCGTLLAAVRDYRVSVGGKTPCFFLYGRKGVGKSTTLRYFVNKMLSMFPSICLLDCDPGQTEFTCPGCVSLTEVTEPLLGPPFTHMKTPEVTAFCGTVDISECLALYNECVQKVSEFYKKTLSHVPLFVNTFGWVEGIGKEGLDFIRSMVTPDIEIEIARSVTDGYSVDGTGSKLSGPISNNGRIEFKILSSCPKLRVLDSLNRRNLAILSYFGKCQTRCLEIQPFNNFQPYCLSIEKVVIHILHQDMDPDLLINAINAQFVALYHIDREDIKVMVPENNEDFPVPLPKTLTSFDQKGDCIGFGFVRAVDVEEGLIFVVTPEPVNKLAKVNALIKGNIAMPKEVFEKQKNMDICLSYVMKAIEKKGPHMKKLKPFFCRQSAIKNRMAMDTV